MVKRTLHVAAFVLAYLFVAAVTVRAETSLLNVSYDVARELYKLEGTFFKGDTKFKNLKALEP